VNTVAAEWLKLRSVRSTWYFVLGALATMMLVAALDADGTTDELLRNGAGPGAVETASEAVAAAAWVHFILGALGMLAMTSEYATRGIMVTLSCTPSRTRLLLAKTAVVAATVFPVGLLGAGLAVAVSAPVLGDYAHADAGQISARILAVAVHLTLIAVLALGLGTLIRRSAGTITVLFLGLTVLPVIVQATSGPLGSDWPIRVADYLPGPAGDRFMNGDLVSGLVLAAWAAAAVVAGCWILRRRDA
jgi:hypothetical protein